MTIYLLDTNVVSYLARNSHDMQQSLVGLGASSSICISVISEAELRFGLAKTRIRPEVREMLEFYLSSFRVLDWTQSCVAAYADLRVTAERSGRVIAALDLLIAAQAKAEDATLVTSDKTIAGVKGVSTLLW